MIFLATIAAFCAAVTACLAAAESTPYTWYAYSPGNMAAVRTAEKGPSGSEIERLTFSATDKSPGDYWAGAGAALTKPRDDNAVTFFIRKTSPQQRTVTLKLMDSAGHPGYYELNVPTEWIKVQLRREQPVHTDGGPAPVDIAKIEFILNNTWFKPGETWDVDVAGLKTGKILPLAWQNQFWMPAKIPLPVPGNRIEVCLGDMAPGWHFPGINNPSGIDMAQDVTEHLKKEYGAVGVETSYLRDEPGQKFTQFLHQMGSLAADSSHNHSAYHVRPLTVAEDHDLWAKNAEGKIPWDYHMDGAHGEDMTNPRFLALAQQMYLQSAKAGADVLRPCDYVWPYLGGGWTWTYSEAALKAWPEDLKETDAGLELGQGIDPKKAVARRVAHFWEYFGSYHGYRMTPQDLGLTSWDEYRPPASDAPDSPHTRNNHILLDMLYHYEWVKFANEVARPAAEQYGMLSQPVCNPEEVNNGTDLYWLNKLRYVRGFWTEWWGGAGTVLSTYYNGTYYDNVVKHNGKEMVLGGEVAAAGGNPYDGKPFYWDNMATYLIAYAQTGSTSARALDQQYWGWTWAEAMDPKRPEHAAYTTLRSSWSGFLQNRNDKAVKPKTDLLAVSMRAVTQGMAYFDHGSEQPYNLGQTLVQLNYLHDGAAFPLDDAYNLDDYRTVVLSSFEPPQGFAQKLNLWLAAKPGRLVITHSFVPTRFSAPVTELRPDPIAFVQPGGQEKQLGFGSIQETGVTSGILRASDPIFKFVLKAWDGKQVTFSRGICRTAGVAGEKPLVTLGDQPLVSLHRCGKGHVLYLHFFANETSIERGALQQAILDAVLRYAGYKPTAIMPEDQYAVMLQEPSGGKVFITCNLAANTALQDAQGKVWGTYQSQDPSVKAVVRLLAGKPNTHYRVTDAITGAKQSLTSDGEGYVRVSNDGWNMRGLSVEEDKPRARTAAAD